jgi:2-polyprenyl-3-methyl-5-hydroxy-6-metoxy-1,4-benzoquinol methylase
MKNEGERLLETDQSQSTSEHLHRYKIASLYSTQKVIVDIACGEGYGSKILSKNAKRVFGFDIDKDSIEKARIKYKSDNLTFDCSSVTNIPLESHSVDIVVSFETIEHIVEQENMISEIKRILNSEGILIISSPNKYIYTDIIGNKNKFHLKELYTEEFIDLIKKDFTYLNVYFQRFISASYIYEYNSDEVNIKNTWYKGDFNEIKQTDPPEAEYVMIIASNKKIENLDLKIRSSFLFEEKLKEKIIASYQKVSLRYKIGYIILSPLRLLKKIIKV